MSWISASSALRLVQVLPWSELTAIPIVWSSHVKVGK